jgi:hypothetical protein
MTRFEITVTVAFVKPNLGNSSIFAIFLQCFALRSSLSNKTTNICLLDMKIHLEATLIDRLALFAWLRGTNGWG